MGTIEKYITIISIIVIYALWWSAKKRKYKLDKMSYCEKHQARYWKNCWKCVVEQDEEIQKEVKKR